MDRQPALEAHKTAEQLKQGLKYHDEHTLSILVDEITDERKSLGPAKYKDYLADLNKEMKTTLHGLSIDGVTSYPESPLLIMDKAHMGGAMFSGTAQDQFTAYLKGNSLTPDGTYKTITEHETFEWKSTGPLSWREKVTGPTPLENYSTHKRADGIVVKTYADGHGYAHRDNPDGTSDEQGFGKKPIQNYVRHLRTESGDAPY